MPPPPPTRQISYKKTIIEFQLYTIAQNLTLKGYSAHVGNN